MRLDDEFQPVGWLNQNSESAMLLVCEHAGRAIPSVLGRLGVSEKIIDDHTGWDIGAFGVAKNLANLSHAELIFQNISRLVIDCNRPLSNDELIPEISEDILIPGNASISAEQRKQRIEQIWIPFQDAISRSLDRRHSLGRPTILVAVHSFNPVYRGISRPWHICLAYNRDDRLAKLLYDNLKSTTEGYEIALNKPYFVSDDDDQTIPVFGEARGIPHVLLEIRNDLLPTEKEQMHWASTIARSLRVCIEQLT